VNEEVIEGMTNTNQLDEHKTKLVLTREDVEKTDEELTKILERMNPDDLGNA
jgi:hypothetical protein